MPIYRVHTDEECRWDPTDDWSECLNQCETVFIEADSPGEAVIIANDGNPYSRFVWQRFRRAIQLYSSREDWASFSLEMAGHSYRQYFNGGDEELFKRYLRAHIYDAWNHLTHRNPEPVIRVLNTN